MTWAVIGLLRQVLGGTAGAPREALAFQMAAIVIGLPIFLAHWRWAGRLTAGDDEERTSAVRRVYLYGLLALFLVPFLANAFDLVAALLGRALGASPLPQPQPEVTLRQALVNSLAALVVLGVLWLYHWRLVISDRAAVGEAGRSALVRRVYVLGFSAFGVGMVAVGFIQLLRWIMFQFGSAAVIRTGGGVVVAGEVARLAVGLPAWLLFWRWAERLARGPDEAERESALRLFYLNAIVFVAVLVGVTNAAMILAGALRRVLGLSPGGDIRDPLPVVLVLAAGWLYYARLLQREAGRSGETARQAGIRRLYHYLVAGVALGAFVFGLGGVLNVAIGAAIGEGMTTVLKEQLAWSTAAILAGLAVWLPPWRRMQLMSEVPGSAGVAERASVVRKLYLYFYLFVATITVLAGAVYIVARLFMHLLGAGSGGSDSLTTDLPRSIAYGLVGVGVWLYHGRALRRDGDLARRDLAARLAAMRTVLLDVGDGRFGCAARDELARELPGLDLVAIGLTPAAARALGEGGGSAGAQGGGAGPAEVPVRLGGAELAGRPGGEELVGRLGEAELAGEELVGRLGEAELAGEDLARRLGGAELIVAPWQAAVAGGDVPLEIAAAVSASPARKVLVPQSVEGWDWAGVERYDADELVAQTVAAVRQVVAGEVVRPARPLGAGAIIGIVIGLVVLTGIVGIPIMAFLMGSGMRYLF